MSVFQHALHTIGSALLLLGVFFSIAALGGVNEAFGQTIWFAPRAPYPPAGVEGAADFMGLFQPNPPWPTVAAHVKVLKLPTQFLAWVPEDQLGVILTDLRRNGIALAVESLAQNRVGQPPCGHGVEGYGDPNQAAMIASKIHRVGGQLRYLAMDEPLYFGHFYDGPTACHSSAENVAERVAAIVGRYRSVFPQLVVGDIEPAGAALIPDWGRVYADWLAEFRKSVGISITFFDADVDWNNPNHLAGLLQSIAVARKHALTVGVIYNGRANAKSDEEWIAGALANIHSVEAALGHPPDAVIFQSWDHFPHKDLPESQSTSFTWLIRRYLRSHGVIR